MSDNVCRECKYFNGFDGVGELWTGCHFGDFKGIKTSCNNFEKKITKADLLRKVSELERENEQLIKDKEQLKERLRECGMRLDRFNCR